MKCNKLKSILSIVRPVGAAEQMLPQIGPADLIKRYRYPVAIIQPNESGRVESTSRTCAPMGKRETPRNRNILSSTKPIR